MTVTLELLKQTVVSQFDNLNCKEDAADECMAFTINTDTQTAQVALKIFNSFATDAEEIQAIALTMILSDQDEDLLDLTHKNHSEVVLLCNQLQHHLGWSIVSPCRTPSEKLGVSLYRSFQTSTADLRLAQSGELSSELLAAIVHVSSEPDYIAPVLQHYATTKVFPMHLVDHMLQPNQQSVCS